MRIKLAILDKDINYLDKIVSILSMKYSNKLILYSFTDVEVALLTLSKEKIDVFLVDAGVTVDTDKIPSNCGFAYFVDSLDIDSLNGRPAVCKFQKVELIYKQVLNIFSDALGAASVRNIHNNHTKIITFTSPCGGTGTSTLAAAYAIRLASLGNRPVYLNFEDFSGSDIYFQAEGAFDMSDVIYAVKSQKTNLAIKLESYVKHDSRGVAFFSTARVALDMMELDLEGRGNLVSALAESGMYDVIIIDSSFGIDKEFLQFFSQSHALIWVCDGLAVSSTKIARAYEALKVKGQNEQDPLTDRIGVICNKFSSNLGNAVLAPGIQNLGVIPKIRHRVDEQIIDQVAVSDIFDAILDL